MTREKKLAAVVLCVALLNVLPLIQYLIDIGNAGIFYFIGNILGLDLLSYGLELNLFLSVLFSFFFIISRNRKGELLFLALSCLCMSCGVSWFGDRSGHALTVISGVVFLYVIRPTIILVFGLLICRIRLKLSK